MQTTQNREHIEFIQSQVLDWQPYPHLQGVDYKLLSEDKETGALTGVFSFPVNWQRNTTYCRDAEEEFFVLTGKLVINN